MSIQSDARSTVDPAANRRALTLRHIEHVRAGGTDTHPDGARVVPASEYLDPELATAERALLRGVPLVAAHSSQLPGPRSYRAETLLDVPVLLVRQDNGGVKAFLNSCSHRAARLVEGQGQFANRISCPYHAWTYSTAGELLSVTQQAKFGSFDKSCHSLVELPCAERLGLVFVLLDQRGELDIDAFLGDFAPQLELTRLADFAVRECRELPHDVNWKLALCGYLESYHVKVVHAASGLAAPFIGNVSTHDSYGPRGRHFVTTWSMNEVRDMAAAPDVDAVLDGLAFSPYNTVLYIWPNTVLTAPDFIGIRHLVRLFPGERPHQQLTDFRILLPQQMTDDERAMISAFDAVTVAALEQEDYGQVEGIQRAMSSGLRDNLLIGANEPSVTEMHRNLARALGRPDPDLPAQPAPGRL
ncbi:MAG TPA: aromatic ring-hydroxylating dioxygenase subunit alpha [Pseudonocardia sp.]|jgi:nitrite reductase/ring-hydroxylating ferredoxin subunit